MLRTDRLVRLYDSDAAGMLDAELVDDVGWRLWERLSDVLRVNRGDVRCPSCGTDFHVVDPFDDLEKVSTCPGCGWTVTVAAYGASKRKRDLHGNCPAYVDYVERFPKATTPTQRMMMIDAVVHELHLTATGEPSNFAARNFIEGSRSTIVALLERLATGPGSTTAAAARERWQAAASRYREQRS
jgi:ribosomal protein L37AE/L43A